MKAIWSFAAVAIFVICMGTLLIAWSNVPFEAAFTAAIAAFSTAGPVYNSGWAAPGSEAWPAYSDFGTTGKWAIMALMLLGRLEVLVLLGLFSRHYWRNR